MQQPVFGSNLESNCFDGAGHAWLGHGWSGCSKVYERPAALDVDYGKSSLNWAPHMSAVFYTSIMCGARHVGEPVDKICKETSAGSNIFVREWTKATVKVDCNTWQNSITMK